MTETSSLPVPKPALFQEHAHNPEHYLLWDEVKFIDRDLHWYTHRVKEVTHIRLHPNNINRDSRI